MSLKGFFSLKTSEEDGSTNLYDLSSYVLDGETTRNFGYELGKLEIKLAKKQAGVVIDFTKITQNKRIRLWKGYWANPTDQSVVAVSTDTGGANTYNESTAANNATPNDMNLMKSPVGTGDFYAFGAANKFSGIRVNVGTAGVGTYTVAWQYSSGNDINGRVNSWTSLQTPTNYLIGNAQNWKRTGNTVQRWKMPTNWTAGKITAGGVDTATAYFVRAIYTITSITTLPLGNQAFIVDTKQFDGYITEVVNVDDNTVIIRAMDRLLKAKEAKGGTFGAYTLNDYTSVTSSSTIISDIITFINNTKTVNLSFSVFPDFLSSDPGFNVNNLRLQGFNLYERLQMLGLYSPTTGQAWEIFYMPEEDLVHFEPRFGFETPMVINYDNAVFINQRPVWEEDKTSIANTILVIGNKNTLTGTASDAGNQASYGVIERRWNRPDIENSTDITNIAGRLLDVFTYYFDKDSTRTYGKTVKFTVPHVDTYGLDLNQRIEVNDQYPVDTAKDVFLRIESMNIPITQPLINMVCSNRHPLAVSPEVSNADRIERVEYRSNSGIGGSGPIGGSGTNNTIVKWTPDGNTLGNSRITDTGSSNITVSASAAFNSGGSTTVDVYDSSQKVGSILAFSGLSIHDFEVLAVAGNLYLGASTGIVLNAPVASFSMTGNLAMGTNKITGLGAGTSNGDSVRYEQFFPGTSTKISRFTSSTTIGNGSLTDDGADTVSFTTAGILNKIAQLDSPSATPMKLYYGANLTASITIGSATTTFGYPIVFAINQAGTGTYITDNATGGMVVHVPASQKLQIVVG